MVSTLLYNKHTFTKSHVLSMKIILLKATEKNCQHFSLQTVDLNDQI